jgi:hypothetical protein
MPPDGTYLLTNVGFSKEEKPILVLQRENTFNSLYPTGESLALTFDPSQRYCVGWRDMTTGERFTCPGHQTTMPKYEQCAACQKRTGFNPAFYHATTVSAQQEARNLEPHILYLAHFGPGVIKVGISHAKRGHSRLLEQGARSALILDELPSAHIARQYEAQAASLPGIVESLQVRKKISLALTGYDFTAASQELTAIKQTIETSLGVVFRQSEILTFDTIYFPNTIPQLSAAHSLVGLNYISGSVSGMMGSLLFCTQQDKTFYIPLKKYVGYNVSIDHTVTPIATEPRQTSLF